MKNNLQKRCGPSSMTGYWPFAPLRHPRSDHVAFGEAGLIESYKYSPWIARI
jgi:hypothetical protein